MGMRIPRSKEVDHAIAAVGREVKLALKELNAEAGRELTRGHYDKATAMVEQCRKLGEFGAKVQDLRREWRDLRRDGQPRLEKQKKTPAWRFYKPIAMALKQLGGRARRTDIERKLAAILDGELCDGDMQMTSGGLPKWKIAIRRSRQPMIREGFLAPDKGGWWCLTDAGRKLAVSTGTGEGQAQAAR